MLESESESADTRVELEDDRKAVRLAEADVKTSLNVDNQLVDAPVKGESVLTRCEVGIEPYEGMEFESEEAARIFYGTYAQRLGFCIRISKYSRSRYDNSVISRQIVCAKEGFREVRPKKGMFSERRQRPRAVTRVGCKAMIMLKKLSSGRWIVSKFIKEHNHGPVPPKKLDVRVARDVGLLTEKSNSYDDVSSIQEPFEGMEFDSEEAAKTFYSTYARHMGFRARISKYCRSRRDNSIISRHLVCSKEGFREVRVKKEIYDEGKTKRTRAVTRIGCKAMIIVKRVSSGKWMVSKFEKDHNHPLVTSKKVLHLQSHNYDERSSVSILQQSGKIQSGLIADRSNPGMQGALRGSQLLASSRHSCRRRLAETLFCSSRSPEQRGDLPVLPLLRYRSNSFSARDFWNEAIFQCCRCCAADQTHPRSGTSGTTRRSSSGLLPSDVAAVPLRKKPTKRTPLHSLNRILGPRVNCISFKDSACRLPLLRLQEAITPSPSDLKGKSGYSRRTSTELLKVLNRIWSLEEQHSSTISLVTKLKLELENAYTLIEELLQEKQSNHHEIDNLTKQIVEDKLARKGKEQEKIKATVKSLEAELEKEKSLRRHSESLHRRLGKELSEVKVAFSKIMRDLEGEKKSHNLLEDLCDEFAKGIRQYEDEVRELKWKYEKGSKHRCNSFILDFAEAWLDERLQIKLLDCRGDLSEKKKMVDNLECEVEAFIGARRSCSVSDDLLFQKDILKERCLHRQSLESIHLTGAGSAPQYAEDEDSVASDFHCFELKMGNATERHDSLKHNGVLEKLQGTRNSNVTKKMVGSSERLKYHGSSSSWTRFDGHTQSCNDVKMQFTNKVQGIHRRNTSERRKDVNLNVDILSHQNSGEVEGQEAAQGMNDKLGGTDLADQETGDTESSKLHNQQPVPNQKTEDLSNDSCGRPRPSLGLGRDVASGNDHTASSSVQKWSYHHVSPDLQASESSKLSQGIQESTLKTRLLEARLEGQHARLKASRGSSVGA